MCIRDRSITLVDSHINVANQITFGGKGIFIRGSVESKVNGLEFDDRFALSIEGTAFTAAQDIDFFGSFDSISSATFSAVDGDFRIADPNSVVQM